jgi:hypothetical protein
MFTIPGLSPVVQSAGKGLFDHWLDVQSDDALRLILLLELTAQGTVIFTDDLM